MVDRGDGIPIVLIPGLQGRWEWMRPAVDALARQHRVITFSLCDEPSSPFPCNPKREFENYVGQVERALDRARVDQAIIVGVSYGGLIATEFTTRHQRRVQGLVLVNALHRSWTPNPQQQRFLESPRLLSPLFVATAPGRMGAEMAAAFPNVFERVKFMTRFGMLVVPAPASPWRMARRIEWAQHHQFAEARDVSMPTLIVTGEPDLDRVVPVEVTRRYLNDWQAARHVVLKNTGHNGLVTRPDAFAGEVERFVNAVRLSA